MGFIRRRKQQIQNWHHRFCSKSAWGDYLHIIWDPFERIWAWRNSSNDIKCENNCRTECPWKREICRNKQINSRNPKPNKRIPWKILDFWAGLWGYAIKLNFEGRIWKVCGRRRKMMILWLNNLNNIERLWNQSFFLWS